MIKNKKENLIHTMMMVFFIAVVMTAYNVIIHQGFSKNIIQITWMSFPLTFIVAFTLEYFIVGKRAMKLAFKFHKGHHTNLQKRAITALCIVPFMAGFMSLYGAILTVGFSKNLPIIWIKNLVINFGFAYLLILFVAGPLVGFLFRKVFPEGTIVDITKY